MRPATKTVALAIVLTAAVVGLFQFFPTPSTPIESVIEIAGVRLTVEIADTAPKQERGLMFRESLPEDRGMLFVFTREGRYSFWMKDVRFPLDIIWFDENRRAVFFTTNLAPCNAFLCPLYTPDRDAKYVLEVKAGFVDRHAIVLNSTFVLLSQLPG